MMKHWRQRPSHPFTSVPWPWLLRACFLLGFGNLPQSHATRTTAVTAAHILMNGTERCWLHMGAAATAPIILDRAQFGLEREHQLDF